MTITARKPPRNFLGMLIELSNLKIGYLIRSGVYCFVVFLGIVCSIGLHGAEKRTLRALRETYVGKRVVVQGTETPLPRGKVLMDWQVADQTSPGRFEPKGGLGGWLPAIYKGQEATIQTIQVNARKRNAIGPNALGEVVSEDDITNPYCDVVVRFDDGTVALTTRWGCPLG